MTSGAQFSTRLARNVRVAIKLLAALWLVGVAATLIRGGPFIDIVLTGVALFFLVGPGAVLTYSALSTWRTRGVFAHYGVWVATLVGGWLPLFLLAQAAPVTGVDFPLFDHPVLFFVAMILAGLVWGSITRSIEGAQDRAQRVIGEKRSA